MQTNPAIALTIESAQNLAASIESWRETLRHSDPRDNGADWAVVQAERAAISLSYVRSWLERGDEAEAAEYWRSALANYGASLTAHRSNYDCACQYPVRIVRPERTEADIERERQAFLAWARELREEID